MPETIDLFGYLAAFLTSSAFVPQAVMIWRTDDTRSISAGMYSLFVAGIALWLAYGIMLMAYPIILANAFTLAMSCMILYKKLIHIHRGKGV